ncbi:MAG TPA: acyl carrier protein [Candidatus Krumholzibacteria bacterium]|nr:acyl carrier protein [Candidatus Krumholzibacteria bacterium]HPD71874.1 acyl carrier protein [Candidatus Krumholzibacteria bacterium]HRY41193.1 acyl carrier protein [Candidatus Krumholzibacteria bacterium]
MTEIPGVLQDLLRRTKPDLAAPLPPAGDWADWGLDSLDLAELAARIEQHYRLDIPDEDWRALRDFGALRAYLEARLERDA